MTRLTQSILKTLSIACIMGMALAAVPTGGALAAGEYDEGSPPVPGIGSHERLERAWLRLKEVYGHQADRLSRASEVIEKVQLLIAKAEEKGLDSSLVQAALEAFTAHIPRAQEIHTQGSAILAAHAGFDGSGEVTDPAAARETVSNLAQVVKDAHDAMEGTGISLREAIRALRELVRPGSGEIPPEP
jgi:hypothetical protein